MWTSSAIHAQAFPLCSSLRSHDSASAIFLHLLNLHTALASPSFFVGPDSLLSSFRDVADSMLQAITTLFMYMNRFPWKYFHKDVKEY